MPKLDIEAARKEGYSDKEIKEYLMSLPSWKEASDEGYSDNEQFEYFGFGNPDKHGAAGAIITGLTLGGVNSIPAAIKATARKSGAMPGPDGGSIQIAEPESGTLGQIYQEEMKPSQANRRAYNQEHPILGPALETLGAAVPTTLAGALVPEFAGPAMLGRAGPLAGRIGTRAAQGVLGGAMMTPLTDSSLLENVGLGASIGAAFPLAGSAMRGLLGPKMTPEISKLLKDAQKLGVYAAPGAKLGEFKALGSTAKQVSNITRGISRTIGEDTDALTLPKYQAALDKIGLDLDAVVRNVEVDYNRSNLHNDLNNVMMGINGAAGLSPGDKKLISNVIGDIRKTAATGGGKISGEKYQQLTQYGSMLGQLSKNESGIVNKAGGDISDSLFDALVASSPSDKVDQLLKLKSQYRSAMTIGPDVHKAVGGVINSKSLINRVKKQGDLRTLAEISKGMKDKASYNIYDFLTPTAIGAGAIELGMYTQNPMLALKSLGVAGGAYATSKAIGYGFNNPLYRNWVLNQASAKMPNPLLGAVIGSELGVGRDIDGQ